MKVIAITSCPAGIAHTYMAAEALQMAGKELGVDIKVETQGSIGVENEITSDEVKAANAIIIAADTTIDMSRFKGLPVINASVQQAIKDSKSLIRRAMQAEKKNYVDEILEKREQEKQKRSGPYKHLMTGVSYMIPFVVTGGILIALSFMFGIKAFEIKGSLAAALMQIGGGSAFALIVPILAGFIAYSIADRPGIVPGMIGGMISVQIGAGFLGGIIVGFGAGYLALFLKNKIKLPKSLEGLKPILILPILTSLVVGLLMIFVIGKPVAAVNQGLADWLNSMKSGSAILLGIVLGLMMAFDMGGPVNKAAYTFAVGTIAAGQPSMIMAAVMAAGMVPPLGLALATVIGKKYFSNDEKEAGKAAFFLGISFITEGAIPFAAADPFRVIPSIMVGSAVTGALSMIFKCTLAVPHGGVFVLPIPNAVGNLALYAVAIIFGSVVAAFCVTFLKGLKAKKDSKPSNSLAA